MLGNLGKSSLTVREAREHKTSLGNPGNTGTFPVSLDASLGSFTDEMRELRKTMQFVRVSPRIAGEAEEHTSTLSSVLLRHVYCLAGFPPTVNAGGAYILISFD